MLNIFDYLFPDSIYTASQGGDPLPKRDTPAKRAALVYFFSIPETDEEPLLLNKKPKFSLQNARDKNGNTILHRTILEEDLHESLRLERIQKYLAMGENPNIQNNDGNTPLHLAIKTGRSPDIIQLLLEKEATQLFKI